MDLEACSVVTEPATLEEFPFPFLPVLTGAGRPMTRKKGKRRCRADEEAGGRGPGSLGALTQPEVLYV